MILISVLSPIKQNGFKTHFISNLLKYLENMFYFVYVFKICFVSKFLKMTLKFDLLPTYLNGSKIYFIPNLTKWF